MSNVIAWNTSSENGHWKIFVELMRTDISSVHTRTIKSDKTRRNNREKKKKTDGTDELHDWTLFFGSKLNIVIFHSYGFFLERRWETKAAGVRKGVKRMASIHKTCFIQWRFKFGHWNKFRTQNVFRYFLTVIDVVFVRISAYSMQREQETVAIVEFRHFRNHQRCE